LQGTKEEKNVLHTIKWEQASWIRYILRKSWLLTDLIERKVEGKIEVTGKEAGRCK